MSFPYRHKKTAQQFRLRSVLEIPGILGPDLLGGGGVTATVEHTREDNALLKYVRHNRATSDVWGSASPWVRFKNLFHHSLLFVRGRRKETGVGQTHRKGEPPPRGGLFLCGNRFVVEKNIDDFHFVLLVVPFKHYLVVIVRIGFADKGTAHHRFIKSDLRRKLFKRLPSEYSVPVKM